MLGLNDRLWIGYWTGAATAWLCALIAGMLEFPAWLAFFLWCVCTPIGMFIADQRR